MNYNEYLRFSMILSENQDTSFKKSTLKIIKFILMENAGVGLSLMQIKTKIKEEFSLEFTDIELYDIILSNKTEIEVVENNREQLQAIYTLTGKERSKMQNVQKSNTLELIVKRFLKSTILEVDVDEKEIMDLLNRFLYFSFNNDLGAIIHILRGNNCVTSDDEKFGRDFTHDEKNIINCFLEWNDDEKNNFVYSMISCSYDYCLLTLKRDKASYTNLFKNKTVLLDANIIIRLLGINSIERKEVLEAFVEKCELAGIILSYTNFTLREIMSTIAYYTEKVKRILAGGAPFKPESISRLIGSSSSYDFYNFFYNWYKQRSSFNCSLNDFEKYLDKNLQMLLSKFKFITFDDYENGDLNEDFMKKSSSLSQEKEKKGMVYDQSIKVDVNNFMYLNKFNEGTYSRNYSDIKGYMISADKGYIDWAARENDLAIPVIMFPSVLYSVLLKYVTGRTDDDFAAFTQFLLFRQNTSESDLIPKGREVLTYILSKNETIEIKEEIAYVINKEFFNSNDKFCDMKEVIDGIHETITNKYVEKALEEERENTQVLMSDFNKTNDKKIDEVQNDAYNKGIKEGINKSLENQAESIAEKNVLKIKRIQSFVYLVALIVAIFTIKFFIDDEKVFGIIGTVATIMSPFIAGFNKIFPTWIETDKQKILKRLKKLNINTP